MADFTRRLKEEAVKERNREISAIIEAAYLACQRFVFLGKPHLAPGPYAIHFGTEWHPEATHGPEQRRADGDKKQDWRRRTIRRVAL